MSEKQAGVPTYFRYWGKAQPSETDSAACHLLPFHLLDVAVCADAWWEQSPVVRRLIAPDDNEEVVRAWIKFFVALHDLGKFDIRFQLKAPEVLRYLRPDFDFDAAEVEAYTHGPAGCGWLVRAAPFLDDNRYDRWQPWIEAVAGHHGDLSGGTSPSSPDADEEIIEFDHIARVHWLRKVEALFLVPAGLSLDDDPPECPEPLAGLCAVADWIGSNRDWFPYRDQAISLEEYWDQTRQRGASALAQTGILGSTTGREGMSAVFPSRYPRQIQHLVDAVPDEPGLLLVEAPTGSGKTEFALSYAARLLTAGLAEAIIFALPTQATANAMLTRLEEVAPRLFEDGGNVVLAHGRARFHKGFAALKEAGRRKSAQGREDAAVQCVEWLAQSRKRVFLGQIGVCTIDQVLVSVLAVRHQFVRAFGLRRAVLIVDEVHAYDAYMYGLLTRVLTAQAAAGGSTVLMSATLPAHQRDLLLDAWGVEQPADQPMTYPLLTWGQRCKSVAYFDLEARPADKPETRTIRIDLWERENLLPAEADLRCIVDAAMKGARVAIICNLVADAQALWRRLKALAEVPVDLFHARFIFSDREQIEQRVLNDYGPGSASGGRILVATQVVEQSLDLDFDWLITQLCPVDLAFQRMGRLHRHDRQRPDGFQSPVCTVLAPFGREYGVHEVVYGHRRVLWRTHSKLTETDTLVFPGAYRDWIEVVYAEDAWKDEPEDVQRSWEAFQETSLGRYFGARQLAVAQMIPLPDTEASAARMTRDGDNSAQVLLTQEAPEGVAWLDGRLVEALDEFENREAEDLNTVNVPASWSRILGEVDDLGRFRVKLHRSGSDTWTRDPLYYHRLSGLEKKDESA